MKRALIVLMGSIGDVARALPLAAILKAGGFDQISWVIEPKSAELIRLNRYVDRVIVFDRKRGLMALPQFVRELRAEKYDLVLDLQRHFKSGIFSWLSAATRRIGFHISDAKEFNWIFNPERIEQFGEDRPKLEQYLLFAKKLGLEIPETLDFGLEVKPSEVAKSLPSNAVALVLGSSWESKDWHPDGYAGLISIIARERPVVLLGDRSRCELAERLSKPAHKNLVIDLTGKTTLGELVTVLERVCLAIGPDSGPGHIMAALGKPYVALIGPTNPSRVAPYGSYDLSVTGKVGCAPCQRRRCPGLGQVCMRLISPEMVWNKACIALGQSAS